MKRKEAEKLLTNFQSSTEQQHDLAQAIDYLARLCAAGALLRGFHDDEQKLMDEIKDPTLGGWVEVQILQAELGRQASEIGEAIEAVRKPKPDEHCPEFFSFVVEEADCIIRIGDTCGKRGLPLGDALVQKLLYNMSRPYKHGKNS